MNSNSAKTKPSRVLFETAYGNLQPPYWWLFGFVGVIGLVGVPVGIFWNKGWQAANHPLEPWAATLIIEIFSVGALLTVVAVGAATLRCRKSPQRVAITDSALLVPKGMFSSAELVLPLAEIDIKIFDAGFVRQLQIMHGRKKRLLSSAFFPSNTAFDDLVSHLPA
jgi:hypothetical protein